ncbi:basic phospholipase A2 Tbo-G6D49-like isoform X2 [Emydura macquarii macquarii]
MEMKNLFVFAVLFACGPVMTQGSLLELQRMIKQVTGKNAIWNYSMYGCFCGWGGKGMPKDATDQCCRLHDCCYDRLSNNGCNAITDMYSYFYLSKTIYCGLGSWCETQSCECDKKFVHCLKRHLGSYNKKYRFYRKRRCGTEKLSCSKFAEMLSLPNINVFAQGKSNKM